MSSVLSKDVIYKMCLEIMYLIYMYKKNLALNYLQWLICNQTKPNQAYTNNFQRNLFGLVWFYGIRTVVGYWMTNTVFTYILDTWFVNTFCWYSQIIINFDYIQLNVKKTILFLTLQFSISHFLHSVKMCNSSIWSINRALSVATTADQSGPGIDGNKGALRISQSSYITKASPFDWLMSYPGHSLVRVSPLCRDTVSVFNGPSRMG